MKLVVDVISDVICPWCYIGKRRLEKAIAALDGQPDVQVHWHPFQLNPTMPKEGISRREYRTRKFGSWERSTERMALPVWWQWFRSRGADQFLEVLCPRFRH